MRIEKVRVIIIRCGLALLASASHGWGELAVTSSEAGHRFFGGTSPRIELRIRNEGDQEQEAELRTRLFQASTTLLMPVAPAEEWTRVRLAPGKAMLEQMPVAIPSVRAPTLFFAHVYAGAKEVARVRIEAYPKTMLRALAELKEQARLLIFDPEDQIGPALQEQNVEFQHLGSLNEDIENGLVIIGPFPTAKSLPENFPELLTELGRKTEGVILMLPRAAVPSDALPMGAFEFKGVRVVLLPSEEFRDTTGSPEAQDLLARAVRIALAGNSGSLPPLNLK